LSDEEASRHSASATIQSLVGGQRKAMAARQKACGDWNFPRRLPGDRRGCVSWRDGDGIPHVVRRLPLRTIGINIPGSFVIGFLARARSLMVANPSRRTSDCL
jgi:hypothetical protein